MICPVCKGEMWNNIGKKKNPKAPDYKCKDPECSGVIWPPKEKKTAIFTPVNDDIKLLELAIRLGDKPLDSAYFDNVKDNFIKIKRSFQDGVFLATQKSRPIDEPPTDEPF